jgi:DNA-binding ferritin-like protein
MEEDTLTVDTPESTSEVQENSQFNSIGEAFEAARQRRQPKESKAESDDTKEEVEETEPEESKEEAGNEEVDPEEPEDVSEEEAEESDETDEDVLSQTDQIDFDSLSDEQKDELAEKLEVKSHKAFAELRKQLKEANSKLEEQANRQADNLNEFAQSGDNVFKNVDDLGELQKSIKQAEVNVDYFTDALLKKQITQYDESSGEDVYGIEHDGKFYDKDFVLNYVEQQKKALRDGKAREKQVQAYNEISEKQKDIVAERKAKLGITAGSEASKEYDKLLESSSFKAVAKAMPEYAQELIDLFGNAVVAKASAKDGKVHLPRKGPKGKQTSVNPPKAKGMEAANSTSAKIAALDKKLKQGVSSKDEMLRIARQKRQLLNQS